MTEPDPIASFKGGPNDGKRGPLDGGVSRILKVGPGPGRYELNTSIAWHESGVAIYQWRVPDRWWDWAWTKKRPFVGAYEKGRTDARNEENNRSHLLYTNRGWGHQFITAYDHGYREQRRELAEQKRLELE